MTELITPTSVTLVEVKPTTTTRICQCNLCSSSIEEATTATIETFWQGTPFVQKKMSIETLQEEMEKKCQGLRIKKQVLDARKSLVDLYKFSNGCNICNYFRHPSALCFNHLPEFKDKKHIATKNGGTKKTTKKGMNAGGMWVLYDASYPVEVLIAEIKKCEILCVRCHQELTYANNPLYLAYLANLANYLKMTNGENA